jgi:hypothetical protein
MMMRPTRREDATLMTAAVLEMGKRARRVEVEDQFGIRLKITISGCASL